MVGHKPATARLATVAVDSGLCPSDCMDVQIAGLPATFPYRENDERTALPMRTLLQCGGRQLRSLEQR